MGKIFGKFVRASRTCRRFGVSALTTGSGSTFLLDLTWEKFSVSLPERLGLVDDLEFRLSLPVVGACFSLGLGWEKFSEKRCVFFE